MKLRLVVEPNEDVYVAYCPELPKCVTYGKTEEKARKNIMKALELYLRLSEEELAKGCENLLGCCLVGERQPHVTADEIIWS